MQDTHSEEQLNDTLKGAKAGLIGGWELESGKGKGSAAPHNMANDVIEELCSQITSMKFIISFVL